MARPVPEHYCHIHQLTVLVCPLCNASKGGRATARRHTHEQLSRWGRSGGRGNKKPVKASSVKKTAGGKKKKRVKTAASF